MDSISIEMTREYTELLEILKMIPKSDLAKIPKEEIEYYERNKDRTYSFKLDPSIELSKQNVSRGAYALFVILYEAYIATPDEKKLIEDILELNEKKKTYSVEKKNVEKDIKENKTITLTPIKESLFKRCIKKIKSFFGLGEVK